MAAAAAAKQPGAAAVAAKQPEAAAATLQTAAATPTHEVDFFRLLLFGVH